MNYPCMVAFTEVVDALMGDFAADLLILSVLLLRQHLIAQDCSDLLIEL